MALTVALAVFVAVLVVLWVDVLGLRDPIQVALQVLLQLLLLTQLLEVSTRLRLLALLGELSGKAQTSPRERNPSLVEVIIRVQLAMENHCKHSKRKRVEAVVICDDLSNSSTVCHCIAQLIWSTYGGT